MSSKIGIIDSWVNPLPDDLSAERWRNSPILMNTTTRYRSQMLEMRIEHLLDYMAKYRIDRAVLTAMDNRYFYVSNDWVAELGPNFFSYFEPYLYHILSFHHWASEFSAWLLLLLSEKIISCRR